MHEETEAIYKENQSLNRQQIALNEEVRRCFGDGASALPHVVSFMFCGSQKRAAAWHLTYRIDGWAWL